MRNSKLIREGIGWVQVGLGSRMENEEESEKESFETSQQKYNDDHDCEEGNVVLKKGDDFHSKEESSTIQNSCGQSNQDIANLEGEPNQAITNSEDEKGHSMNIIGPSNQGIVNSDVEEIQSQNPLSLSNEDMINSNGENYSIPLVILNQDNQGIINTDGAESSDNDLETRRKTIRTEIEHLQTKKEELQTKKEELQTKKEELQTKSKQLKKEIKEKKKEESEILKATREMAYDFGCSQKVFNICFGSNTIYIIIVMNIFLSTLNTLSDLSVFNLLFGQGFLGQAYTVLGNK